MRAEDANYTVNLAGVESHPACNSSVYIDRTTEGPHPRHRIIHRVLAFERSESSSASGFDNSGRKTTWANFEVQLCYQVLVCRDYFPPVAATRA
ncbi:MAG: hypothetical protein L0K10_12605, partial [Brevibacterium aurantiacum]|nr:hypothetical protein [Brevibacterium aurantiacum]